MRARSDTPVAAFIDRNTAHRVGCVGVWTCEQSAEGIGQSVCESGL